MIARRADARQARGLDDVDVINGGATARQQLFEQPHLRREVSFHVAVIIEMVARQVGESRSLDRHAVETELIETVARRFQCNMIDAGFGEFVQVAMQRDRIGRRQAARLVDAAAVNADRPHADATRVQLFPNLTEEDRRRGLAIGAGDSSDRLGLRGVKARGGQGERAAGILLGDDRHRCVGRFIGQDRGGALGDSVVDEAAAIGFAAGQGGEQEARLDGARIRGQTGDVDVC